MNYYFAVDSHDKRHIVVANSYEEAEKLLLDAKLSIMDMYILGPKTFNQPGFLISDK